MSSDTFKNQLTETLKRKGVKHMSDLIKHYNSITHAVNDTSAKGYGEIGRDNYDKAKNLTLKFKKRDHEYKELKNLWKEYEEIQSKESGVSQVDENYLRSRLGSISSDTEHVDSPLATLAAPIELENEDLPEEIDSDKDLAVVLLAMIQEIFYNPTNGLWSTYDTKFKRESFIKFGKPGWENSSFDSHERGAINKRKNEEVRIIMDSVFVHDAIVEIYDTLHLLVFGLKKREVRHAVKNHVRYHLFKLIYGNANDTKNH